MEANNLRKEDLRHRLGRIWVSERNEVAVFAELVHHDEDDGLPIYAWQRLDEVEPHIRPHCGWYRKGQEQLGQVKVLGFVPLADGA
jgi:hypothetical protein